jgi:hypothetical protein
VEDDTASHLLIEEAVLFYRQKVDEKTESDRQAWMDAEQTLRRARGDR